MSKKSDKKKSTNDFKEQNIIQLGNFIVKRYDDGIFLHIRITTAEGGWSIDYRQDNFKYAWVLTLLADEKFHDVLQAWMVMLYHVTACNPDPEFFERIFAELDNLGQRAQKFEADFDIAGKQ